ncbi:MAG TPA: hypothetical protein VGY13_06610 [Solirubrobacteraceae bacterium]|jgi:hypothetical protein|nr:hypothetical protein [Solirubrobacteraceae bacterium]
MPVTFELPLSDSDREQLRGMLSVSDDDLDVVLTLHAQAAMVEYLELFLGR